jgi:hypothetical protein
MRVALLGDQSPVDVGEARGSTSLLNFPLMRLKLGYIVEGNLFVPSFLKLHGACAGQTSATANSPVSLYPSLAPCSKHMGTSPIRIMEKHVKFTEWAQAEGVVINGVAAHKFHGRGLGIIAEKNFKVRMTITIHSVSLFT